MPVRGVQEAGREDGRAEGGQGLREEELRKGEATDTLVLSIAKGQSKCGIAGLREKASLRKNGPRNTSEEGSETVAQEKRADIDGHPAAPGLLPLYITPRNRSPGEL